MAEPSLRNQSFWLYGVIIGLAIKEALTRTLPHLFDPNSDNPWLYTPELIRLVLFLFLSVRFYLGAVHFFQKAYEKEDSDEKYKRKSFGLDFLFGFMHFIFFSALALAIEKNPVTELVFVILLSLILLYDILWLLANWNNDTYKLIKLWAFVNLGTFILAALFYIAVLFVCSAKGWAMSYSVAETAAFVPILLVSAIDVAGLIKERSIFGEWFGSLAE